MKMKRSNSQTFLSSAALLATTVMGCADAPGTAPEIAKIDQEIIGGVAANSASLNAIGALVYHVSYTDEYTGEEVVEYSPLCTGSLISAQTVLTAKHCAEGFEQAGQRLFFHIGPDSYKPQREVEVVAVQRAPGNEGGWAELGSDVATFHLLDKVTDVTPLALGTLNERQIGKDFAMIGYGVQDNTYKADTRVVGTGTLGALSGAIFPLMFGSFEAFRDWFDWINARSYDSETRAPEQRTLVSQRKAAVHAGADPEAGSEGLGDADAGVGEEGDAGIGEDGDAGTDWAEEDARNMYEGTFLLEGYEAYVGNRSGNAQACYGDSGGPLVRTVNGKMRAYAVVSGGVPSEELVCNYGVVYASFGPEVMDFLKKAKKWVDPCKGLSTEGVCEGDVAKRCTAVAEGPRRITKTNCGLLAQTCGVDDAGVASCVDR